MSAISFVCALILVLYSIVTVYGFMSTRIAHLESHKQLVAMQTKDLDWKRATSVNRDLPRSERLFLRQEARAAREDLKKSLMLMPDAAASSIASIFNTGVERVQRALVLVGSCVGQLIKVSCLFFGMAVWPHRPAKPSDGGGGGDGGVDKTDTSSSGGGGGGLKVVASTPAKNAKDTAIKSGADAVAETAASTVAMLAGSGMAAVGTPPPNWKNGMRLPEETARKLAAAAEWFVKGGSPWRSIRALARHFGVHHTTAGDHVQRAERRSSSADDQLINVPAESRSSGCFRRPAAPGTSIPKDRT
jgi:hypothetical protein